jgi:predicted short-subunit dehydrogenase-like oxidoreductase (DUF2520 family)
LALRLNILGTGRLGKTLGRLFHSKRSLLIQAITNQSPEKAQESVHFMGAGIPFTCLKDLPEAEITLLSVPDGQIETVCMAWAQSPASKPGNILFHASGACSSALLQSARDKGVWVASVHPLKSFASPEQAAASFAGTFCAMEGDEEALAVLGPLFKGLGAELGRISPETKPMYHAASVMACGGLTALYACCEGLLKEAGVPAGQIQAFLAPYMKETLSNNQALGPRQALTGPVARGDWETVAAHEEALTGEALALYQVLTALQKFIN